MGNSRVSKTCRTASGRFVESEGPEVPDQVQSLLEVKFKLNEARARPIQVTDPASYATLSASVRLPLHLEEVTATA